MRRARRSPLRCRLRDHAVTDVYSLGVRGLPVKLGPDRAAKRPGGRRSAFRAFSQVMQKEFYPAKVYYVNRQT